MTNVLFKQHLRRVVNGGFGNHAVVFDKRNRRDTVNATTLCIKIYMYTSQVIYSSLHITDLQSNVIKLQIRYNKSLIRFMTFMF